MRREGQSYFSSFDVTTSKNRAIFRFCASCCSSLLSCRLIARCSQYDCQAIALEAMANSTKKVFGSIIVAARLQRSSEHNHRSYTQCPSGSVPLSTVRKSVDTSTPGNPPHALLGLGHSTITLIAAVAPQTRNSNKRSIIWPRRE